MSWREVTRTKPCPVCHKPDYCAWTPDGRKIRCMRGGDVPAGMRRVGMDGNGGELFSFGDGPARSNGHFRHTLSQPVAPTNRALDWANLMEKCAVALSPTGRAELAADLGVSLASLDAVPIGWADAKTLREMGASGEGWPEHYPDGAYCFFERSGDGRLVGAGLRAVDGRKGSPSGKRGSKRGLIVPTTLGILPDPILVVEGASDVLAALTLGIAAVGRPSCNAGADDLARLLKGRTVLVVGEHDVKPDGRWPGRDGAESIALRLASTWRFKVAWTLPANAKDIRAGLQERITGGLDPSDAHACRVAGRELLAELNAAAVEVEPEKVSMAERLVRLALEHYQIGRTESDEPFAVELDGPNIALMFKGSRDALRSKLTRDYRRATNRTPNASALTDAMTALQGEALDAEAEPVALRLAEHDGGIVIDLGDAEGRAVVVGPGSWEVVDRSPVLFRRTALTGALPVPERGGDISELRRLLNATDESWPLVLGWSVAALIPSIPHPILMLGGEQGTGKTTLAWMLVCVIDASPAPLRSQPREPEAWAMAAAGSWAVCIDNVSVIPGWWSDALCKAVTGDGWVRRKLYSDSELSVLEYRRVIVLTSIDVGAMRGDLGDRLLLVDLERIDDSNRLTEAELKARYRDAKPRIFGALLDVLAGVLAKLPALEVPALPRMADFARVLAALDSLGVVDGSALKTYLNQRGRIAGEVVDADAVAVAIARMVESCGLWSGTAGELLTTLGPPQPVPKDWPGSPRAMAGRLRRIAPALRAVGIELDYDRAQTRDRSRIYTIRQVVQPIVQTVQQCPDEKCAGVADGLDGSIPKSSEDSWGEV